MSLKLMWRSDDKKVPMGGIMVTFSHVHLEGQTAKYPLLGGIPPNYNTQVSYSPAVNRMIDTVSAFFITSYLLQG